MPCRCAERAEQLRRALVALGRGDREAAADLIAAAGRSAAEDARAGLQQAAQVASARLGAGRR